MTAIQILIMKYFKPQLTMHDISIVDKYMDTINDDEVFKYKFFDTVAFDKSFEAHERLAAIDYACGVSGAYTKYLKILAVRCKTHIKPLVGVDFQLCSDGAWRVHLHAVLRSEKPISYDTRHKLWKFRRYGQRSHVIYDDKRKAVPYILKGHQYVPWHHYACPGHKAKCRGSKGCWYSRKGGNDLVFNMSRATGRSRQGEVKNEKANQHPLVVNTTYRQGRVNR